MPVNNIDEMNARQTSQNFSSGMEELNQPLSAQNLPANESAMKVDVVGRRRSRLLELYEHGNSVEVETRDLIRKARKMRNHLNQLTQRLTISPAENSYCL